MENNIQDFLKIKMEKTIQVLKDDLHSIRAGRANPALLDHITVEYYEVDTPLKQLANISVPEPRMLLIQPYDVTNFNDFDLALFSQKSTWINAQTIF